MPSKYRAVKIDGVKHDLHRVVAEQKIGRKLTRYEVVHHIDGDKLNNDPDNLEVMTLSEHSRRHQTGRRMSMETRRKLSAALTGRINPSRPLSREQVYTVLSMTAAGVSSRKIAAALGIARSAVVNIQRGVCYRDVSEEWAERGGTAQFTA